MIDEPEYGKILKNVPIPERGYSPVRKYDFSKLQVGDAILLPATAGGSTSWAEHRYKIKLTKRTINENSIMVWRIK